MAGIKVIEVNLSAFALNDSLADEVRAINRANGTYLINIMASPGAGKTTLLLRTIEALRAKFAIGVMEADIESTVDVDKMDAAGVRSIQIHTGGECAMTAQMTRQAIDEFQTADLDLVFLENVGNLVCTAEEDVGADLNVEILSVPEGDDKPLKYPLMFQVCDAVIISKTDTVGFFKFDFEALEKRVHALNPDSKIFFLSAKTGEGMEEWIEWLTEKVNSR